MKKFKNKLFYLYSFLIYLFLVVVISFIASRYLDSSVNSFLIRNFVSIKNGSSNVIEVVIDDDTDTDINYKPWGRKYETQILDYFYTNLYCVALHSSAIYTENGGTLFVGEKNAGKSSLCLGGIVSYDVKLVSDDITLLFVDSNNVYATGLFKGINANENTISVLKTGMQMLEQSDFIKDRYIPNDSLICKETRIDRICFSRAHKTDKRVVVTKIKKKTFEDQFQRNIIRSFFGKKYHMNPYLVTDIITTLYNTTSVYNVKLNSNLMVSFEELNEIIGIM